MTHCNGQEKKNNSKNSISVNVDFDTVKKYIELQKNVETEEYEPENPYDLSKQDLDIAKDLVYIGLKNAGFRFISDKDFSKKLSLFFSISEKNNCKKILIEPEYITLFGNDMDGAPETWRNNQYELSFFTQNLFLAKKEKFLMEMFLVKDLIKFNNNSYSIQLPKYIIARNKYLFNDSKADLPYLLHNDQDFLKALVIVFGYEKEPKINELVMRDYEERNHLQHREEIGDILFVKDCEGKLEIREGLLEYIARRTQSEEKRLADALYSFIVTYLEDKTQFTPAEKRKIVAYAAQTYEPLYEKFYKIGWPMGSMLMMYLQSDEGAAEEFRKNRYYGLPDLQRYTEQALWQIRAENIQPDVQEQDE